VSGGCDEFIFRVTFMSAATSTVRCMIMKDDIQGFEVGIKDEV
jgi:hypothetical protein